MTFLVHDPSTFAASAGAGFALVHADVVHTVAGGVVCTTRGADDQVAVVIGGGSGHYPAFAGLVGPGLAHGAVLGNIFASPSSLQVESVAKVAEQGRGVLLCYGNYAGDVLQFDGGAARLEAAGIPVRTVRVTDDMYSAPVAEKQKRRGIAGDLAVIKVAGAAAAAGYDLEAVYGLALRANEFTRTLGVAFTGCQLPGSDGPLFEVPKGRMAVGLGIHGESGLAEVDVPTPEGLAELFVSTLLGEIPGGGDPAGRRVVVIVNGLGAFKFDEMYVVYGEVRKKLDAAGVVVADSKVGEFCTSFEMAGVSLTLFWLDDELEELWFAAASSPEFVVGAAATGLQALDADRYALGEFDRGVLAEASQESLDFAPVMVAAIETVRATIDENVQELGRIDAIAGDGDHGIGMQNGAHAAVRAARAAVEAGAGAGTVLSRAGDAWSAEAGGTSGALWGLMLNTLGGVIGDSEMPSGRSIREGVRAACDALMARGGAKVGDKTMVDAISPFADEINREGAASIADSWKAAAEAAQRGAEATKAMLPGLGRARSHGEKAVGVPDPGAVSFSLIVAALEPIVRGNS